MVAAVSEAGGLGCFGGAGPSAEQLRSEIRAIRMLSS